MTTMEMQKLERRADVHRARLMRTLGALDTYRHGVVARARTVGVRAMILAAVAMTGIGAMLLTRWAIRR